MSTCRGAVFFEGKKVLAIKKFPIPEPKHGELLVKIEACTICGSDIHTIEGKRSEKSPTILGHEVVGTIIDLSSPVRDFNGLQLEVGHRITWSVCFSCRDCDRCRNDMPQKCRQLKKFGHEYVHGDGPLLGGFSDMVLLPAQATVFQIPPEIKSTVICPVNCATATVIASMELAGKVKNKRILIIGAGMLGLTAGAYCSSRKAKEIVFLDQNKKRIELSKSFGASKIGNSFMDCMDDNAGAFDLIFDFAGSTQLIQRSLDFLTIGGKLILVGTVMPVPELTLKPESLVRKLISIYGVHNYRPEHLNKAIEFLLEQADNYPFAELVERSFPLEKINEAIKFATNFKPLRVMIEP